MTETTKTETPKKTEAPAKGKVQTFLFPRAGITVEAKSLEDAQKNYTKTLKENKEQNDG